MDKRKIKIYLYATVFQFVFTVCWTIIFKEAFPKPIFSCVATLLFAHVFFWFGFYGPRLGFQFAKEKGKLKEQMASIKWIIFGWFLMFGLGGIFMILNSVWIGHPERIMFASIPLALSIGAYDNWKLIQRTLNESVKPPFDI